MSAPVDRKPAPTRTSTISSERPLRYLVVGLAKTGTTVISKTLQNTAGIENYYMEPKSIHFFESLGEQTGDGVVKILFDHWHTRRRLLNAVIHNELGTNFAANIFITRDPRAELISRLNYVAYPYFLSADRPQQDVTDWIDLFRRKENDPNFSLRELVDTLHSRFDVSFTDTVAIVSRQYSAYINQIPTLKKVLIRYEDFLASKLDNHPLKHLFGGSREVGNEYSRTRRSGELDDWRAFVTPADLAWLNDKLAAPIEGMGYDLDIELGGAVDPENCSRYVERIIAEALQPRTAAEPA